VQQEAQSRLGAPIRFRPERARRLLGMDVSDAEMCATFVRLGLELEADGHEWQVAAPSFRFDLALEVDLIEEIARIKGYDNLPAILPSMLAGMPAPARTAAHAWRIQVASDGPGLSGGGDLQLHRCQAAGHGGTGRRADRPGESLSPARWG
jgi:phenylalanyl-tRNA synthetase beta subunit